MPSDGLFEDDVRAECAALDALEFIYREIGIAAAIAGDTTEQGLALEGSIRVFQARQELLPHVRVMDAIMLSAEVH